MGVIPLMSQRNHHVAVCGALVPSCGQNTELHIRCEEEHGPVTQLFLIVRLLLRCF